MSEFTHRVFNTSMQLSILAFTAVLVYFAFVYYPNALNQYKTASLPQKPVVNPVVASTSQFPIETESYRIVYESGSDTYYVFVEGENLDSYLLNKNASELALKNALSTNEICDLNIIFGSLGQLPIAPGSQKATGC